MTTVAWKEELLSSRKSCKTEQAKLIASLSESRKKLAKQIKRMGLEQNWNAKKTAEEQLKHTFYSNFLSATYPVVDLSFASGKMKLLIERTQDGARIVGPADREADVPAEMVINVDAFAKQTEGMGRGRDLLQPLPSADHRLATFIFPSFQKNREKFRSYNGQVKCNRPDGSPKSLRRKFLDIVAIGLEARAAAVRAGVVIEGPDYGRVFLWKPRLEDLYITEQIPVRDDPAVLVTLGERAHLVAFWDSPEENPIEGLLREFSEGSFENVTNS